HTPSGDQDLRPAGAVDIAGAGPGRGDKVDLVDQRAPRMLLAKQDYARHGEIHVSRSVGPGKAPGEPGILSQAHEVDVGRSVDLHATQEEGIDPALAGAVEQLTRAIGETVVAPA